MSQGRSVGDEMTISRYETTCKMVLSHLSPRIFPIVKLVLYDPRFMNVIEMRRQFETDLLNEVIEARGAYEKLSEEYLAATRDMRDAPGTDGTLAAAQAQRLHREVRTALEQYSVALRKFSKVVVHQEFPEFPESLKKPKD